jgi:hypothetical protein
VNNGWFWVPGPVVVRPVWAPALVAFVGGGPGFHFSAGVGVGWFPLAPGEVYVPGYRVSRTYVNNVNITNTTVNVTRVTNVYNTVVVNRSTTINNVTYVNQRVNGGVTVVSHETFVNARPVAHNIMRVESREVVSAPITRGVPVEPIRKSVIGAGAPVRVRPPSAVISRPVVAVRTPPAPVRSLEQRQVQAGGHLNEQSLVRPLVPARPAPLNQSERSQPANPDGFRPFRQPISGNDQESSRVKPMLRPQPRVYEQQGTAVQENRNEPVQPNRNMRPQPENREMQPQPENRNMPQRENREFRPQQPAPPETHPLVRPAPQVQQRTMEQEHRQEQKFNQWHEQRPASPPPQQRQQSRPEPQRQEKPKK